MPRRTAVLDSTSAAIWLLLATLAALARGLPAPQEDDESGPLPLIQFTKGGIRVNFGGYHAQAGLGGLLTGKRADGGLHASAGTPDGAHASAGLGGSLTDGPAGGLHARAGLGNGGPEAEAGLGGTLAGPRPRGELYAGSSAGSYAALDKVNGIDGSVKSKHVQVIARPKKATEQAAAASANGETNVKGPSSSSASSGATANAGASNDDESRDAGTGWVNLVPPPTNRQAGDNDSAEKSQYPARWYFKKRLRERAGPYSQTSSYNASPPDQAETAAPTENKAPSPSAPAQRDIPKQSAESAAAIPPVVAKQPPRIYQGIFARAAADNGGSSDNGGGRKYKSTTLFDDIFNIPISALNAVNQLLKNHVG